MSSRARLSDCQMPSEWCNDFSFQWFEIFFFDRAIAPLNTCTHTQSIPTKIHSTDFFFLILVCVCVSRLFYICTQLIRFSHPEHLQKNEKVTKHEANKREKNVVHTQNKCNNIQQKIKNKEQYKKKI